MREDLKRIADELLKVDPKLRFENVYMGCLPVVPRLSGKYRSGSNELDKNRNTI